MSKPSEYLMYQDLISLIERTKLSLHALRLFHACYAYTDRTPLLSVEFISATGRPGCTAACSELATITGSPAGKSTAWIKDSIDELKHTNLMAHLSLDESGKLLTFKFSSKVAMATMPRGKKTPFAMLDSNVVATISSAPELLFYTRAKMVGGCDHPSFHLANVGHNLTPWTDETKKSWLRVAARVGLRLKQDYLVLPVRDPLTRAIVGVRVKVVTENSKWTSECLFPRRSGAGVSIVHDGRYRSLTKSELFDRRMWTRITTP